MITIIDEHATVRHVVRTDGRTYTSILALCSLLFALFLRACGAVVLIKCCDTFWLLKVTTVCPNFLFKMKRQVVNGEPTRVRHL